MKRPMMGCIASLMLTVLLVARTLAAGPEYSWQQPHAKVLPTGDLQWAPKPYEFVKGETVRYIDFEKGDDNNDGTGKDKPWKHHPWDLAATGKAKGAHGPVTYVFKRGVAYRGVIANQARTGESGSKGVLIGESGQPGNPIRLTSDPAWGEGKALILGSIQLPAAWVRAESVPHPDRIPQIEKVWALDLKPLGVLGKDNDVQVVTQNSFFGVASIRMPFLGLFRVDPDGSGHMQHLARTPDWQPGNENFALDYWHKMDGDYATAEKDARGRALQSGIQAAFLKGHPADWFTGGFIWPQYGSFMGGPLPREILAQTKDRNGDPKPMYDPARGVIFTTAMGPWGPNLRYMIDNLPQYLDADEEFYYDKTTGQLFYRPPAGQDPNKLHLEWTRFAEGIHIDSQKHIEISGLDFRHQSTVGVGMFNDVADITVRNCTFHDVLEYGLSQTMKNWRTDKDEKGGVRPHFADRLRVLDCDFRNIWTTALHMSAEQDYARVLGHIDVLRNNFKNTGFRHKDNLQTPLPCVEILYPRTAEIAGNIVEDSWGSGLMIFAGIHSGGAVDWPLSRVLVHHNKTMDTALAVNDYGGMSLWQGGSIYCYNNNIGNSPGVMPAGITMFGGAKGGINLSYPLYLDGAYKVFSFNNIIWARSNDKKLDPYATGTPGYFMVFGFLNQLTNNTFYRTGDGVGGSGGHRNDVISNVFSEISGPKAKFIAHDRQGDPSLIGGGDDGGSGRRGVPTLAYADNVFYGDAKGGTLLRENPTGGIAKGIEGDTVEALAKAMQAFPIRFGQLGCEVKTNPIVGKASHEPINDLAEVDFRPSTSSPAIDKGATYFVPWSLHGTVGEWNFTENRAEPGRVIDYAWYQYQAHYYRMIYEYIPPLDLQLTDTTLADYVDAPSEDWARGAVVFDGTRFGTISDKAMRQDIAIPIYKKDKKGELERQDRLPGAPWILPQALSGESDKAQYAQDALMRFPGSLRKTLIIRTENLLVEAALKTDAASATILAKHDGRSGYRLAVNSAGRAEFTIGSAGQSASVATSAAINDGKWHHVLAEVDRKTGQMSIYLDGKLSGEAKAGLASDASLDNGDDFLVGKSADGSARFRGAIDFMRVCQGTLRDADTDIAELYEWQTSGPARRDFAGNAPKGRRDAGALER